MKLFLRTYILSIDINQLYYSDSLIKNYITLNVALQACGHHTPDLTKAICDFQEAFKNMHEIAIKARQRFDHVGLQGTVREELDEAEKDKLI